ncbi:MAG: D-sedoheptulose-7-phosphate isomerase [Bacteroidia bacterium]
MADALMVKRQILEDNGLVEKIAAVTQVVVDAFQAGHRLYLCGNGGSAADAQHLAAEFSGRFYVDRKPLPAEALHVNTSYLTAVANDYSYEEVYARLLQAMARKGDILWAFSTSGNSKNILRAIYQARQIPILVVGFTGHTGGAMRELCDYLICVPSRDTPRIQEGHMLIGHIICQLVEEALFGKAD